MWELCKNREARFLFFSFLTLPSGSAWHQLFFLFPETPRERIFPRGRGQIEGEVRNKASSSQNSFVRRSSVPITLFVCPECRLDSSVWIKQLVFWCRAWRSLHRSVFDLSCLFISWLLSDPCRRSSLDCRAVRVDTRSIPGRYRVGAEVRSGHGVTSVWANCSDPLRGLTSDFWESLQAHNMTDGGAFVPQAVQLNLLHWLNKVFNQSAHNESKSVFSWVLLKEYRTSFSVCVF